jgi:hypothetical protein
MPNLGPSRHAINNMNLTPARQWERADVVAYLRRRAADYRRERAFVAASLIDDMAREIEDGRHHRERARQHKGDPNLSINN